MRKILWLFFTVSLVAQVNAQSNAPVRLALIAEGDESSRVSDILAVELSKNPQIKLLERNEIDKVYREQGLSAANHDYLKLGQVLGADGLLLVRANPTAENTSALGAALGGRNPKAKIDLNAQLIAVRPGVLLASDRFSGIDDVAQWAPGFAAHLNPLLPKLSVLPQDAVPVSIINLRAAIQSPETQQMERDLTALTLDRLSRERQVFVLERQNLQLLAAEKELKGLNDTAFWNGSYLLDGTLDRNGYSKDTVTISARLVPPKGGVPLQIEVSGSRTNLADVINQLADKVRESLKLAATAVPWNAADEAQKYFEEAKWALKWNLLTQAQSAANSAWSLGKQDMECALVRVSAYTRVIPEIDPENVRHIDLRNTVTFLNVTNPPYPDEIDQALQVLRIYNEFSQALPRTEPQQDSPFYFVGLTALSKATGVLRHFHYHPETWTPELEKLADLRAEIRRVAGWIALSPSVRGAYWVQGHIPTHDEIYHSFRERSFGYPGEVKNFFEFELQNLRFWQERPEDSLAQYRTLMENPLFVVIHKDLWLPEEEGDGAPRLMAWDAEDKKKIPALWENFIAELDNSTNYFLRMEAKAAQFGAAQIYRHRANQDWSKMPYPGEPGFRSMESVYAERDQKLEVAWTNLFDFVYTNYNQIIVGRESLLYTGLELNVFFYNGGEVGSAAYKIQGGFGKIEGPKLNALSDGIRDKQDFEIQKRYLAALTPYDLVKFNKVFSRHNYSKEQAAELKPMLENYRSNAMVLANASTSDWFKKTAARNTAADIARFEQMNVESVLHPPLPAPAAPPMSLPVAQSATPPRADDLTNVLVIRKFFALPTEQLPATNRSGIAIVIFGERLQDDKLVLDVRYDDMWWQRERNGGRQRNEHREAVAIWDKGWEVIPSPHTEGEFGFDFILGSVGGQATRGRLFAEIFENNLYVSDRDTIRKYDFTRREWQELPFPGQDRAELFAVNHHLYAASPETIWEVLDGGRSSRILASTRRRPAVSVLDSRETLRQPALFSGRDNSLCVALNGEVFSWDGSDWKSVLTIASDRPPEVYQDAVFFRGEQYQQGFDLWRLVPNEFKPVLCLHEPGGRSAGIFGLPVPAPMAGAAKTLWHSFPGLSQKPLTSDDSIIYFFVDRTKAMVVREPNAAPVENRGRHADLVCLVPESAEPVIVPIRFDSKPGFIPVQGRLSFNNTTWIDCSSEFLFIGAAELPGVWALPKSEIKAEVTRQVQQRRAENDRRKKTVFAKYDVNHNGVLDPNERESAINDPELLEFERDQIDTNDNDKLDGEELAYFDANENRILDPPEEAGIHAMQRLLAARLFRKLDQNDDGQIDTDEFRALFDQGGGYSSAYQFFKNAPGQSEIERLARYLEFSTESIVEPKLFERAGPASSMHMYQGTPQTFKGKVEYYWARHSSITQKR